MNKFVKTDHGQQSLVIDQKTSYLIYQAMDHLRESNQASISLKQQAQELSEFILDQQNFDDPTLFHRFRDVDKCPECEGSGRIKIMPDDRDDEVRFEKCGKCLGEGQLYFIIVKKGYAPTEQIRKQMAK